MASPSLPITSAVSTGAWGRPLRPVKRGDGWDVTPVLPPPPAPAIAARHRVAKGRVVTEILIAAVLLAILAAVFDPNSSQPRLSNIVARMSTDMAALQSSAPGVSPPGVSPPGAGTSTTGTSTTGTPTTGTPAAVTPTTGTPTASTPTASTLSVDARASEAKLKADLTEALTVQPPTDAVAADSWRYALSESTAAIDELDQRPPNRPAAETDLASSLQALLLVESTERN